MHFGVASAQVAVSPRLNRVSCVVAMLASSREFVGVSLPSDKEGVVQHSARSNIVTQHIVDDCISMLQGLQYGQSGLSQSVEVCTFAVSQSRACSASGIGSIASGRARWMDGWLAGWLAGCKHAWLDGSLVGHKSMKL